jgi:hypothetical protein
MSDHAETYSHDLPLFREFGLKPFKEKSRVVIEVGKVVTDNGHVIIKAEGFPALFWMFEIFSKETNKTIKVNTGSGTLTSYWPMVKSIMDGMFVIQSVE